MSRRGCRQSQQVLDFWTTVRSIDRCLHLALVVLYVLAAAMPPYEFDVRRISLAIGQGGSISRAHRVQRSQYLHQHAARLEMHSLAAMSLINGKDGWWMGGLIGKSVIGWHSLWLRCWWAVLRRASRTRVGSVGALRDCGYQCPQCPCDIDRFDRRGVWYVHRRQRDLRYRDAIESFQVVGAADIFVGRCGSGCKVSWLLYAVVPCGVALVLLRRREGVLPAVVGLSITCLPWYAKNTVLTGQSILSAGLFTVRRQRSRRSNGLTVVGCASRSC